MLLISSKNLGVIVEQAKEASSEQVEKKLTKSQKIKKEIKSIFWIFIIVFAFRSTFFEPFRIPSGSMIPTLMIGDFILVNKFSYGFKVPFSDWFTDPVYITKPSNPKRGDVIVFKFPYDKSVNYIKRVIGTPGDEVEIIDKVVYVNGKSMIKGELPPDEFMADMDDKFKRYNFKFYSVHNGEHQHIAQKETSSYNLANHHKFIVPDGRFFVMGDNRDFSSDSRVWGFVPFENIKGEAMFVWFSWILPFGENPMKFRPHRIGTPIF